MEKNVTADAQPVSEGLTESDIVAEAVVLPSSNRKHKESLNVDTSETETVSLDGDRLSIRSENSSSTPTKPLSGVSTPTDKRSLSPPLGAPKRTPGSGGSHSKPPRSTREPPGTPAHHPNRPNRIGITWKINGKVEAMDFQKNWYQARIVDIDDTDKTVLIHFDGWNQRYDEWMDMISDRLRPLARTSGRKEKKTQPKNVKLEHKVGDNVFAKWTDCRMYAGTIVGVNPNASYDVLFYDGFRKTVQPINVKPMPAEVQKEYAVAGMLPHPLTKSLHKLEKRPFDEYKRPLYNLQKSRRQSKERAGGSVEDGVLKSVSAPSSTSTSPISKPPSSEKGQGHRDNSPAPKKRKVLIGGNFQMKSNKDGEGGQKSERKRQRPRQDGQKTKVRKVMHKKVPKEPLDSSINAVLQVTADSVEQTEQKINVPTNSAGQLDDETTDEEVTLTLQQETPDIISVDTAETSKAAIKKPRLTQTIDPILADGSPFPVDAEQFKCPHVNCNKSFRKLSLVDYHVKYYHTQDGNVIQPPPARKRIKTLSVCSSDSEASCYKLSAGRSSQKRAQDYSVSAADIAICEDTTQEFSEVETHTTTTEDQEPQTSYTHLEFLNDPSMDALNKDEIVNCICQLNEENGLMIQCDVCLCWQHALCMELTEETLPSKYICYICTNPPGVRDSMRFAYDQDWLKAGNMARFSFLPEDHRAAQKSQIIKATHSLVGDLHGVNKVICSLNCQLHASRDPNHPETQLWRRQWDKMDVHQNKTDKIIKSEEKTELNTSEILSNPQFNLNDNKPSESLHLVAKLECEEDDVMLRPDGLVGSVSTSGNSQKMGELNSDQTKLLENASCSSLSSSGSIQPSNSAGSLASQDSEAPKVAVVTVIEEPFASCQQNLLEHISSMQDNAECRLDLIEEQIAALESGDDSSSYNSSGGSDILRDLPRIKKSMHHILSDLNKVKRMALYH